MTSLFAEKEEQSVDSSHQQRGVEELNSLVDQLLASGPVDLDSHLADGRLPKVSLAVIQDESVEPRCKSTILPCESKAPAWTGCDASGISLSPYSAEEIAKKQRDEPAFRRLTNFLESGDAPSESELILMGPEAKYFFLERGQFKIDDKGVIWKADSPELDRLLVPGNLRGEVLALVHAIPSPWHQKIQTTKLRTRENFY